MNMLAPTTAKPRTIDYTDGAHVARPACKLIGADGEEIALPALLTAWDGSQHWIDSFKASRYQGNEGYVYSRLNETFKPSVFNLTIVQVAA